MQTKFYAFIALMLLLPGCGPKQDKKSNLNDHPHDEGQAESQKPVSVFEEDVEGFVLEENADPFATNTHGELSVVDVEADMHKTRESQSLYGLKTIYFDFDQYNVRHDQQPVLQHNLQALKTGLAQGKKLICEGHCCCFAGSDNYNMHLSDQRAEKVADYLIAQDATLKEKIKVVGRGSHMPIVATGNKEQQAPNRRVELYFIQS